MNHSLRRFLAVTTGTLLISAGGFFLAVAPAAAAATADAPARHAVQVPVHVPVNVCGNTVPEVGVLNPAAGNTCVSDGPDR